MTRKLDAAIAEALDREVTWQRKVRTGGKRGKPAYTYYACSPDDKFAQLFYAGTEVEVPKFHKDGNAMLELDREMRERGWRLTIERNEYETEGQIYHTCYSKYRGGGNKCYRFDHGISHADIMPKAVALAAYKALTGKEWRE